MERRNHPRRERLAEELAVMKPLAATPLATSSQVRVRVTRGSLIRVQKKVYSVPTSLIGQWVTVRIHEWDLDVYYRSHLVETLPRLIGAEQHYVNYRHVIDSLLRKPGGFRDYRYRDDLFPSLVFRRAWEQLNHWPDLLAHSPTGRPGDGMRGSGRAGTALGDTRLLERNRPGAIAPTRAHPNPAAHLWSSPTTAV